MKMKNKKMTRREEFSALVEKRFKAYLRRHKDRVVLVVNRGYFDEWANGKKTCLVCAIGAAGCAFLGRKRVHALTKVAFTDYAAPSERDAIVAEVAKKVGLRASFVNDLFSDMEGAFEDTPGASDDGLVLLGQQLRAKSLTKEQVKKLAKKHKLSTVRGRSLSDLSSRIGGLGGR